MTCAVDNLFSRYLGSGEVTPGVLGDAHRGEVTSDMTTGFVALCAIYFPSVTGARLDKASRVRTRSHAQSAILYSPSLHPSAYLSKILRCCVKTAKHVAEILLLI